MKIFRQRDGSYVSDRESFKISEDELHPNIVARIVSSQKEVLQSQEIVLWDSEDEINIFDKATGKCLDPWTDKLYTTRDYYFLISDDLEFNNKFPSFICNFYGNKLFYINKNWPENLNIMLEDSELWTPVFSKKKSQLEIDKKPKLFACFIPANEINIALKPIKLNEQKEYCIFIITPQKEKINFIRFNKTPLDFKPCMINLKGNNVIGVKTEPVKFYPDMFFNELHILAGVSIKGKDYNIKFTKNYFQSY